MRHIKMIIVSLWNINNPTNNYKLSFDKVDIFLKILIIMKNWENIVNKWLIFIKVNNWLVSIFNLS